MADNYIEKKMEQLRSGAQSSPVRYKSVEALMKYNRSTRGYDASYIVHPFQLRAIVSVNTLVASARNQQVLRFHLVTSERAHLVLPLIGMARNLPDLHLPLPGTEPNAFIIICTTDPDAPHLEFDEGISAQSMLLKASEMGLNGLMIKNFNPDRLQEALGLPLRPTTVIAIGRSAEKIALRTVGEGECLKYYREDGVHIVPKLDPGAILI